MQKMHVLIVVDFHKELIVTMMKMNFENPNKFLEMTVSITKVIPIYTLVWRSDGNTMEVSHIHFFVFYLVIWPFS